MKELKIKRDFFDGKLYPLLMSLLILIGYFAEIEAYTATAGMLICCVAFQTSKSIKPMMFFLLTFFYQMIVAHSPMDPMKSDHYTTGIRPYLLICSAMMLIVCAFTHTIKNGYFTKMNFFKIPLFVPMLVLSLGLVCNGLLTSPYPKKNLMWAGFLVIVYFVFFLLFYLGLKDEDPHEIVDYFTYISLLISWILLFQVIGIYAKGNLFVNGTVNRGAFELGFGKTNAVGFVLANMIPMNFYGFMKNKCKYAPYLHLFTAFALMGATLTSTSRNAVLVGCVYFAFCLVFSMFAGEKKKMARIVVPVSILVIGVIILIFSKEEFIMLIKHYASRTQLDSLSPEEINQSSAGRINIWLKCLEIFKEHPLFGAGFYGKEMKFAQPMASIIPHFAHNTLFQLLAGTGIFGTLCYAYYRISTLKYAFRKPTLDRFMLMVSASMLLTGSLLDNHVFNIYPGFYYVVALVIAVLLYEKQFSTQESKFVEEIEEMLEESKELSNT